MPQQPLYFSLGAALKSERKRQGFTQADLARQAGLSIPTIRLLERSQGRITSFSQVLGILDCQVTGRNLAAGDYLGQRLAALRKRRSLSQRRLANLANVTPATISAL